MAMSDDAVLAGRRVAVPTAGAGGLAARISPHFGRSSGFVIVELMGDRPGRVMMLEGAGALSCDQPVALLKEQGVDVVVVHGIGQRPLSACCAAGIAVYRGAGESVGQQLECLTAGTAKRLSDLSPCGCDGEHRGDHRQY
jgi:predicted Fe-Mo cluster-binding NifX family protein